MNKGEILHYYYHRCLLMMQTLRNKRNEIFSVDFSSSACVQMALKKIEIEHRASEKCKHE